MSEGQGESEPVFDPKYERIRLVDSVIELFRSHPDETAVHITDELNIVRLLSGEIEPLELDGETYFRTSSLLVMAVSTSAEEWAKIQCEDNWQVVHEYNLRLTDEGLAKLEQGAKAKAGAAIDSANVFKMQRTKFTRDQSEEILKKVLHGNPEFLRGITTDPAN